MTGVEHRGNSISNFFALELERATLTLATFYSMLPSGSVRGSTCRVSCKHTVRVVHVCIWNIIARSQYTSEREAEIRQASYYVYMCICE
jgi:hypothetical protein